ncbi:MAG: hypothetical protein M3Q05_08600 [Bacteroidota bacterium]|nr:hypothetical protein [Bacteroidota bacterium]
MARTGVGLPVPLGISTSRGVLRTFPLQKRKSSPSECPNEARRPRGLQVTVQSGSVLLLGDWNRL